MGEIRKQSREQRQRGREEREQESHIIMDGRCTPE